MKIHYKTILNTRTDVEYTRLFGKETYIVTRKTKNINSALNIDYCCDAMKHAIVNKVLYVQEIGNNAVPDNAFGCDRQDISIFLMENDSYEEGTVAWYDHPLKYCPFCGDVITFIEDYKAKEVTRRVHYPAVTTPARDEMRAVEVKMKSKL